MCCRVALSALLLFSVFGPGASAQKIEKSKTTTVTVAATPEYGKEGVIYDHIATAFHYNADGSGEKLLTVDSYVQTDSGVRQVGLLTFAYSSSTEHLDLTYLRIKKPDGTVVKLSTADQQDLPAEVTRQAPLYSDLHEVQIPVKSLSAGDHLEYQVRWTMQKALAPGQFWGAQNFVTGAVVRDEVFEISYPKDTYALVLSPKSAPQMSEENGQKFYRWHATQLKPTVSSGTVEKTAPADPDALPDIAWTSFHDWQQIGSWYRDLALSRQQPDADVAAKAKQLIEGKSTDEEKIEAIYNFVSTQIRYIGLNFGIGRYQPHAAATVLENQYGDCKDKHTLLAAMLKAAGYDASPVMIGSAHELHVELPSPSQFDHVITVVDLKGQQIWLDSTPEVAPYRMLTFGLRDKSALVIPATGEAKLETTPADGPFPFVDTYTATGTLDGDGTLKSHLDFELHSDNEVLFRMAYHSTARGQWPQLAQGISQNMGYAGTVSNLDISSPERIDGPLHYAYDYERKSFADWDNRRILALTTGVSLISPADDDIPIPGKPYTIGARHVDVQHSELTLPAGYSAVLPQNVKYETDFATYQATYKLDHGKFFADRRLQILKTKVPFEHLDELRKFAKNVTNDETQFIQLSGGASSPEKADSSSDDADANTLQVIYGRLGPNGTKDTAAVRAQLEGVPERVKAHSGYWAIYAYLELIENHQDAAVLDMQKELQAHPDNLNGYKVLAKTQLELKRREDAENTLRAFLKQRPDDPDITLELAQLLTADKKYPEAIQVLEIGETQHPDNDAMLIAQGHAQILSGQSADGLAAIHKAFERSNEPSILNDGAFFLADNNQDLASAEAASSRALGILDKQTAAIALGNLNMDDLQAIRLLAASWDTMGWVYFREGKLREAESYLLPAFKDTQRADIREHLRQVYEAEKKPDAVKKLSSMDLQKDRTTDMPFRWKDGSAEFYFLIASTGVKDIKVDGDIHGFEKALDGLKKVALPDEVPPGSNAVMLRRGILYCSQLIHTCQLVLVLPQDMRLSPAGS